MTAGTVNEPQKDVLEAFRRGDQDALRLLFEAHKDRFFGEGRFRCALVSKSLSAEQAAAVMRYFISAHRGSEED